MKESPKQRFSAGRHVLVGIGRRPATVISVDEVPSIMGEYVHEVLVDGEEKALSVVGCDIYPVPPLDADTRRAEVNSATPKRGGGKGVVTIEKAIKGVDQLRKELADICTLSPSDKGLGEAKLRTWTRRVYEQLKGWGLLAEANEGFSVNALGYLYSDFDRGTKFRDDRLKALRDELATHPEHYASKLASAEQSVFISGQGVSARSAHDLLVLISHSSRDKLLAEALIDLLRSGLGLLPNQIRCSSVDGYRLPAGVNTHDQLRTEIKTVAVLIGLLTPSSLISTYVLFELGARWGANLFMIPLLAGSEPEAMRGPHGVLNALSCEAEGQLIQLVEDIGKELSISPQSTAAYLSQVQRVKALAESSSVVPTTLLPNQEQVAIAPALAHASFEKSRVQAEASIVERHSYSPPNSIGNGDSHSIALVDFLNDPKFSPAAEIGSLMAMVNYYDSGGNACRSVDFCLWKDGSVFTKIRAGRKNKLVLAILDSQGDAFAIDHIYEGGNYVPFQAGLDKAVQRVHVRLSYSWWEDVNTENMESQEFEFSISIGKDLRLRLLPSKHA